MTLVDTSVWVGHLKGLSWARPLERLLEELVVVTHPFIISELVLGGLDAEARKLLLALPEARIASEHEVLHLVDEEELTGRGIGWIDAHLLAAARLTAIRLWTADRSLGEVASALGVGWTPR